MKTPILIRFTEKQLKLLRKQAKKHDVSVASVVRGLVDSALKMLVLLIVSALIIGCSQRAVEIPPNTVGTIDLSAPGCPPLVCIGGDGLIFCVSDNNENLKTQDGLLCATNSAIRTRCMPTSLETLCKHEIAYLGFIELVPDCNECAD